MMMSLLELLFAVLTTHPYFSHLPAGSSPGSGKAQAHADGYVSVQWKFCSVVLRPCCCCYVSIVSTVAEPWEATQQERIHEQIQRYQQATVVMEDRAKATGIAVADAADVGVWHTACIHQTTCILMRGWYRYDMFIQSKQLKPKRSFRYPASVQTQSCATLC